MSFMIAKFLGTCGFIIVLLAMPAGCASPNRAAAATTLPQVRVLHLSDTESDLENDLTQWLVYAEQEVITTAEQIEVGTQDLAARKSALLWKVEYAQATNRRLGQEKSMVLLMDAWAFSMRTLNYLQSGEGKNLFGNQQPLAIQGATRILSAIETLVHKYIAENDLQKIVRGLQSYVRSNPIRGVFVYATSERFSEGKEGKSFLGKVLNAPLALARGGSKALDPTSSLAQSVDRFTELMDDYPALVRWQTQLLWLELEKSASFQTTIKGIDSLSQSSQRLAKTAESLPEQVRRELHLAFNDIDARQPELRKTLELARETIDAANAAMARAETVSATIERSVENAKQAGAVWQQTAVAVTNTINQIQQFGKPSTTGESTANDAVVPDPNGADITNNTKKRFDITEYTTTAEALTKSTVELRNLLSEVHSFLAGETLEKDLSRAVPLTQAALAQTVVETRGIVDYIAWRTVQLCGLVFLLALIYRFWVGRIAVGRATSR